MKIKNAKNVKNINKAIEAIKTSEASKSGKMRELFALGLTIKEIANIMQVRYNFVYNVISNLIITTGLEVETEVKTTKKDLIKALFLQGKTNKEIAIELKTNYNYVAKLVKEIKLEQENGKQAK
jgi:DNA-binding NarL/FixJ family response regulator